MSTQYDELCYLVGTFLEEYRRIVNESIQPISIQRPGREPFKFTPQPNLSFPEYLSKRLLSSGVCIEEMLLPKFLHYIKKELGFTQEDDTTFLDSLVEKFIEDTRNDI